MRNLPIRAWVAFALFAAAAPVRAGDPPIKFFADLSPQEESATTVSPGKGRAEFVLERENLRFSWKVTFSGLTSPATGSAVHGPQRPGTNAGVQIDLGSKDAKPPLSGAAVLTEAQLQYLLSDRMYVNIHTVKYPDGELRGQIHRLPPDVTN